MSSTLYFKINDKGKFDLIERESCVAETRRWTVLEDVSPKVALRICSGHIQTSAVEIAQQISEQQLQIDLEKIKRTHPEELLKAAQEIIGE